MTGHNRRSWPLATVRSVRDAFWAYVAAVAPQHNTRRNRSVGHTDLPDAVRAMFYLWLGAQEREGNVSPKMAQEVTL